MIRIQIGMATKFRYTINLNTVTDLDKDLQLHIYTISATQQILKSSCTNACGMLFLN